MVLVFPPVSPLSPLAFTGVVNAVQGLALLSVLSVVLQEIIDIRNQRTCGEPPSTLGDFVLVKEQGEAAFYDLPGADIYRHDVTPTCPIIYCQEDGTFSTLDFGTDLSIFSETDEENLVVSSTGEITSANYPSNYNPTSTAAVIAWNIMVPAGKNIVFRIEDFDVDSDTTLVLGCGRGIIEWREANEGTLPGFEFTCNKPCAILAFLLQSGTGGRGFKISFRSEK